MYTCSCIDSAIHNTVCKHCHLVHLKITEKNKIESSRGIDCVTTPSSPNSFMSHETVNEEQDTHQATPEPPLKKMRLEAASLISQIKLITTSTTTEQVLKTGIGHLKNALSMMKALENKDNTTATILVTASRIAPNMNSMIQPRFRSTKKKRESGTQTISKPSPQEVDACIHAMSTSQQEVKVCGICFKEDDKGSNTETVHWIQCLKCSLWLHLNCASSPGTSSDNMNSIFICHFCS